MCRQLYEHMISFYNIPPIISAIQNFTFNKNFTQLFFLILHFQSNIISVIDTNTKFKRRERTMRKKLLTLAVATVAASSLLTGCGGSSSNDKKAASDENITAVSREDGSGTRGAFIELFGIEEKQSDGTKVDMTTTDAQITNNTSVMLTTVAGDEYAIGYVSLGSLNDSVKALKIDGAEATADNIENGSYKVSRPFNIAVKKDLDNEVAKDFMAYIMSTEGQEIVSNEKYFRYRM